MERKELIQYRTKNTKHFLKKDGTIDVEIYKNPVHFLEKGEYKDIDNTLVKTKKGFKNKNNDFKIEFNNIEEQVSIELGYKNKNISMIPKNIKQKKYAVNKDSLLLKEIYDNVDLQYSVLSNQLKESIILKSIPISNIFTFSIKTELELVLNSDNTISVFDKKKKCFTIDRPYMFDKNDTRSENILYGISRTEDGYELSIELDEAWLKDKSRVYPVVVDPTITNYQSSLSVIDTYIYNGDSNDTTYNTDVLMVGTDSDNISYRTLLKFELPKIPAGFKVISAQGRLLCYPDRFGMIYSFTPLISVHRLTQDWTESSAKWSNMHDKFDETIEDYYKANRVDATEIKYNEWDMFNLTNLVQKWYNGEPNYGIMLKQYKEEVTERCRPAYYISKDTNIESSNYIKPLLVLTYKNYNGLESYLSYTSQSHGYGSSNINNYTGNLTTTFDVGQTIGGPLPVSISLVYNTMDVELNNDYGYGLGVKPNLIQILEKETIEEQECLKYTDDDGTLHYFYQEETSTYKDEDGLGLSVLAENNTCIMSDKDGNKSIFVLHDNGKYYLEEIINTNDKKIKIYFDNSNRITKVEDGSNNSISVLYEINKITFKSPHMDTVVHLSNNKIISINALDDIELISYNANQLIEKITSPNGLSIQYEYINEISYKVRKVSEISKEGTVGNYLLFSYSLDDTKVTDSKGRINTYIFNSSGNVVGMTGLGEDIDLNHAYGKSYSYGSSSEGTANKLTADKSLVKYVNNLIDDSSFEENPSWRFLNSSMNTTNTLYRGVARSGLYSLSVDIPESGEYIYKDFKVDKGKKYTFSVYMKGTSSLSESANLSLKLSYNDKEAVTKITTLTNEFVRYSVTIDYSSEATEDLRVSIKNTDASPVTFFLDDLQLEEGEVANYYNLISNSGFKNGISGWSVQLSEGNTTNYDIVSVSDNAKALKLRATPLDFIIAKKTFNISGKQGDTFNLSFWYKNNGIIPSGYVGLNAGFFATAFFYYGDEYLDGTCIPAKVLNVGSDNWQFFSENFIAEADYTNLEIRICAYENANDCLVTNFSLFKDLESFSYVYDEAGNLVSATDLNKQKNELKYDKNNQLIQSTNPLGANYKFEYDNKISNRLLRSFSPSGITNQVDFDNNGNPVKLKTYNRNTLSEIKNNTTYYIRAKGTNKYFNVNPDKSVRVRESECSYDKFYIKVLENDRIKIKHAILNNYYIKEVDNKITLQYGDNDNIFILVSNMDNSYSIKKIVDDSNKFITINDNLLLSLEPVTEDIDYKQEFFFEQTENKLFIESNANYTEDGRFINKVQDSLGNITSYQIDSNTGLVNSIKDSLNTVTHYTYDTKFRVKNISRGEQLVSYSYDTNNNLSKITHGTKNYLFSYDAFNNVKDIKINDTTLVSNEYEPNNGNLKKITYGNGDIISYTYDSFDRIDEIQKENDTYRNYYDNLGRLTRFTSTNANHIYEYDFAKRLSTYRVNDYKTTYDYNENNEVVEKKEFLKDKSYTYKYTYNQESALTNLNVLNTNLKYSYDVLGRINEINLNDVYKTKYGYKTKGNKTSIQVDKVDDNGVIYSYTYDALGNIETISKDNILMNRYYYDIHSQLIKEENLIDNTSIEYIYDTYGNILSKKYYNSANTLVDEVSYSYTSSNWQDLLTNFNGVNISYDEIGNPLLMGDKVFTWMNGRELSTYSDTNNTIHYKYNVDGIRTSKVVNGKETKYYLEGSSIIFEDRAGDMLYYIYNGEDLLGFIYKEKTYYYHKNLFGDIIGILNSNYQEIVTYTYDSWGAIKSIIDISGINLGTINPFRYRSYYYDEETKLYYLNSRYYNPEMGRFINADGAITANGDIISGNLFQYVSNNVIRYRDKDGKSFSSIAEKIKDSLLTPASMFLKSMDKKNRGLSNSERKSVVKGIQSSNQLNSVIKNEISVSESNNQRYFTKSGSTTDDDYGNATLSRAIGKFSYEIEGEQLSNGNWLVTDHARDVYDFDEHRPVNSWLDVANNFGFSLHKQGKIIPYYWEVEYKQFYENSSAKYGGDFFEK